MAIQEQQRKHELFLTFDVEGRRNHPRDSEALILGEGEGGRFGPSEMARALSERGLRGTFFIDVFCPAPGLASIWPALGNDLQQAGSEPGLHTHGEWVKPGWKGLLTGSQEESRTLLAEAAERFHAAFGFRPVVHRAGWVKMKPELYDSFAALGIRTDSSVAHFPHCDLAPLFRPNLIQAYRGVTVVPLSTYDRFPFGTMHNYRILDLIKMEARELKAALNVLMRIPGSSIVTLTHSFDLLSRADTGGLRLDRKAVDRFLRSLDVLAAREDLVTRQCSEAEPGRPVASKTESSQPVASEAESPDARGAAQDESAIPEHEISSRIPRLGLGAGMRAMARRLAGKEVKPV